MRLTDLRRFLLSLIGPVAVTDAKLSEYDWQAVNAIAAQHRLQPYLHGQIERGTLAIEIPGAIREEWRQAHRRTALRALAMRKDLLETCAHLARADISPVALKGAWCAWHAYPVAAERPMRDIDLLLPQASALTAFDLLLTNGFRQEEASARTPEQSLGHDKHLPPLLSPHGHRFELHMRLWEREAAIGWPMPEDQSAAMYSRARHLDDDPALYLAPHDMLAHFVVHGVYSNRLNGGPLGLLDVAHLLGVEAIDWPAFWSNAEDKGLAKGAAFMLALVDRWCGSRWIERSACPVQVAPKLVEAAPDLLLQDLAERKSVGLAVSVSGRIASLATRLRGKDRATHGPGDTLTPEETHLAWLTRRLRESGNALAKGDVRKVASQTLRLGQWLDEDIRGKE